jgi:hypothetical protein
LSPSPLLRTEIPFTGISVERTLGLESIRAKRARWRAALRSGDAARRRRAIQEIAAWNRANPKARVAASELAREP